VAIGSYLFLLLVALILAPIILTTRPAHAVPLIWRGRVGAPLAAVIVLAPMCVLLAVPFVGRISYAWIFSLPGGLSLVRFGFTGLLAVAIAARVAIRLPASMETHRIPMRGVWLTVALIAGLVILGNVLIPVSADPRRPPMAVQLLRKELTFTGLASGLGLIIWFIWSRKRAFRRLPVGLIARTQLAVVAQALLIVAVLMPLLLLANSRRDVAHQESYGVACRDVVGDRLGSDWRQRYFEPARSALVTLAPPGWPVTSGIPVTSAPTHLGL
jgi:hypothetical protein